MRFIIDDRSRVVDRVENSSSTKTKKKGRLYGLWMSRMNEANWMGQIRESLSIVREQAIDTAAGLYGLVILSNRKSVCETEVEKKKKTERNFVQERNPRCHPAMQP